MNKVRKQLDPSRYQWKDAMSGTWNLDELSRDDLLQVAAMCLEAIQQASEANTKQKRIFDALRMG